MNMQSDHETWQRVVPEGSEPESPASLPLEPESSRGPGESGSRVGWLERLLLAETLERMMLCGGGLLLLGFVVWLWSCGVFDNPRVLAVAVGSVNLALIGLGVVLVRTTRYGLTGQGLALLGSLALPLNLWLYHAQGLIVITAGGHLWVPALACCLIYAGVARSLRNPHFVYALVSGIVLTGLLFLADLQVNRLWEILPVTTLLVVVGAISGWSANFFPVGGDFSRDRFGAALARSGRVATISGLSLLAGGQLLAWLAERYVWLDAFAIPRGLLTDQFEKWWACGVTTGVLAFLVLLPGLSRNSLMNRMTSIALAGWSIGNCLLALNVTVSFQAVVIGLSLLVMGLNILRLSGNPSGQGDWPGIWAGLDRIGGALASNALALWSLVHFGWLVSGDLSRLSGVDWSIWTTVQYLLAALACWTSDRLWWSQTPRLRTLVPLYLGSVTLSLAVLSILASTSSGWATLPPGLLGPTLTGLAITVAGFWLSAETSPSWRHAASGCVATVVGLALLNTATEPGLFFEQRLVWIGFGLANAGICGWIAGSQRSVAASVGSALLLSFSAAEGLSLTDLSFDYSLLTALSGLGLASLLIGRLSSPPGGQGAPEGVGGHLLGISGGLGSLLLGLSELAGGQASVGLLGFLGLQTVLSGILSLATRTESLTLSFRLITSGCLACSGVVLFQVAELHPTQKLELLTAASGLLILALSHWGLYREHVEARTDDAVTLGLWVGSLTMVLPILIGLLVYRAGFAEGPAWLWGHELGVLLAGLGMFGIGSLLQTRATTLIGGLTLTVYVASLLILFPWPDQLQNTSVLMMILGGLFFLVAILLSAYRERLMQLPEKIKSGAGIYRVLRWR